MDAGKTHDEIVTQSPDRIVGAPRLDDRERQIRELRHLRHQKATQQGVIDGDLLLVHPLRHAAG